MEAPRWKRVGKGVRRDRAIPFFCEGTARFPWVSFFHFPLSKSSHATHQSPKNEPDMGGKRNIFWENEDHPEKGTKLGFSDPHTVPPLPFFLFLLLPFLPLLFRIWLLFLFFLLLLTAAFSSFLYAAPPLPRSLANQCWWILTANFRFPSLPHLAFSLFIPPRIRPYYAVCANEKELVNYVCGSYAANYLHIQYTHSHILSANPRRKKKWGDALPTTQNAPILRRYCASFYLAQYRRRLATWALCASILRAL